ncbi:hypothetical protein HDU89_000587 [Geranomyces variabilis]|nr:hypothetical protein HDU89_000587 [Geranomyces variabilis]
MTDACERVSLEGNGLLWESEIIAAVRRVAAQLKISPADSDSVDPAFADAWVQSLDQMFATVLTILKRTKDLGVDPTTDGAGLENLWRQSLGGSEDVLSLADLFAARSGDPSAVFRTASRSLLSFVEFAATEHELKLLKITWKQSLRFFRLAGQGDAALETEFVSRLAGCCTTHMSGIAPLNLDANMRCGIVQWYTNQLLSFLSTHAEQIRADQRGSILRILDTSSIELWMARTSNCTAAATLKQSIDATMRFISTKAGSALTKSIAYAAFDCRSVPIANTGARLLLLASFLSQVELNPADQLEFFKGNLKGPPLLIRMLAQLCPGDTDTTGTSEAETQAKAVYDDLLVAFMVFTHSLSGEVFDAVESRLLDEVLEPRGFLAWLFASDIMTYISQNGPPVIRARWSSLISERVHMGKEADEEAPGHDLQEWALTRLVDRSRDDDNNSMNTLPATDQATIDKALAFWTSVLPQGVTAPTLEDAEPTLAFLLANWSTELVLESAALAYAGALGSVAASSTKKMTKAVHAQAAEVFQRGLSSAHWVVVDLALRKVVEYSSVCSLGPPKLAAEQRQQVREFLARRAATTMLNRNIMHTPSSSLSPSSSSSSASIATPSRPPVNLSPPPQPTAEPLLLRSFSKALAKRRDIQLTRATPVPVPGLVDFSSNDYLGLARSPDVAKEFHSRLTAAAAGDAGDSSLVGATGSRLLSGNSTQALELEAYLADYHSAPSALLFNSGWDANLSLLSTVPQQNGAIIYDAAVHASIHDGIKLGRAKHAVSFRHNDVAHLREVLDSLLLPTAGNATPQCETAVVAVSSFYSMDGDVAPLREITSLLADPRYGHPRRAVLIVDEAHSTATMGPHGRGLVAALGLEHKVFARLHTFGKGLGAHGAVVLGPQMLRDYLVNYARPLIYSTMMPPHSLVAIRAAYEVLYTQAGVLQARLRALVKVFRDVMGVLPAPARLLPSENMIQGIVLPGNANVVALATLIQSRGFDVKPIRSPTVPLGTERVRVCLHAHNTAEEVVAFAAAARGALAELARRSSSGDSGKQHKQQQQQQQQQHALSSSTDGGALQARL